jgi:transposase
MDNSMDSRAFELFVKDFLGPELWPGAVVVMDNLSSHKFDSIIPMIEAVGASVLFLSPYSPDVNPIELWWSQLKSFLRMFSPTTTIMVDRVISLAIKLTHILHQYIFTSTGRDQNMRKRAQNNINENSEHHSPVCPSSTVHIDRINA